VDDFFTAYSQEKQKIEILVSLAKSSSPEGLLARAEQTLKLESYPSFVPSDFALRFDEASKILILEHEFPDIGSVNWVKLVSLKSGHIVKQANQKEAKDSSNLLYPTLSLRFACELARLDLDSSVEAIVVNGWSNYVEKSTGQLKRAYCSSLFATKTQLLSINLAAADPMAAFSALKGVAARSLELTPIAPILRLNTEDKRFVDAKDVLANMAKGENLAAMDWEDFEHLCRELFEKAFAGSGAEVKVTQASRDQGVDAVIFDPDVLRGGKIVVQAKRYTNTVDVSAVRDLYGAIINEGATKGILVTTSHFGPDAYGFAKDKPITLLNGEELLGLLQKYGYSFRINLAEAKRLNELNK
jgi:restriction system protein